MSNPFLSGGRTLCGYVFNSKRKKHFCEPASRRGVSESGLLLLLYPGWRGWGGGVTGVVGGGVGGIVISDSLLIPCAQLHPYLFASSVSRLQIQSYHYSGPREKYHPKQKERKMKGVKFFPLFYFCNSSIL